MKTDKCEVRSCPYCGSEDLKIYHLIGFWVGCRECLAQGPEADDAVTAVLKWNSVYADASAEYIKKMTKYCQSLMDKIYVVHNGGEENEN